MDVGPSCVEIPVSALQRLKDLIIRPPWGKDVKEKRDERKYLDLETVDAETAAGKGGRSVEAHRVTPVETPCVTAPNQDLAIQSEAETKTWKDPGGERGTGAVQEGPTDVPVPPPLISQLEGCCSKATNKSDCAFTQPEKKKAQNGEESNCGARYLCWRGESDGYEDEEEEEEEEEEEGLSLMHSSDGSAPCAAEDESHYITTHEILLCEVSDQEGDYEVGADSSSSAGWDVEDDNQVYTFVDYAPSDDDDGISEWRGGDEGAAVVSTLQESDLRDAAKRKSSDGSVTQPQQEQEQQENGGGQIHLSITATSRAINDTGSIQERGNILYHATRSADASGRALKAVDGSAETRGDGADCFLAVPGRVHLGGRSGGKDITGCSSCASSELDDADKEVRSLTAKAFKSLAHHPYFDAISFSTSSESSHQSERGINRWSTAFVDLKYGNVNQGAIPQQNVIKASDIPAGNVFTLSGKPLGASSSKKIELMGKFSQSRSGVITLTETLNFRCNVQSGMSGGERRTNFAQIAAGSRSADEVTNSLSSAQRRAAVQPPSRTMEDAHKKAIFASSLIKNVISKKMQFEQERKMERGEIREAPPPCFTHQEIDGCRGGKGGGGGGGGSSSSAELQRQSSRFSESSPDYAIMCVDDLGDIVDSGSCDSRRRESAAARAPPDTNLEPAANEAGIDAKKGALEASKSTLLRSQNSAFRCWREDEVEFQRDRKGDKTQEDKTPSAGDTAAQRDRECASDRAGKATKMSHLFVPSIQVQHSDGEVEQLRDRGDDGDVKVRPLYDSLCVADSRSAATSKSPEIKINLRCVRDKRAAEPFGVSKLRAPNIGCSVDCKSQALAAALKGESCDKVPQFTVRDIRDNKGKLQTPIHQVRDVRKLVKSSYHFVSLDNNDVKPNPISAESHAEQKKQMSQRNPNSVSPIVIKCQSVNTNSNAKQCGNFDLSKRETLDVDRLSPEGTKNVSLEWTAGRGAVNNNAEGSAVSKIESRPVSNKHEKILDSADKKTEPNLVNQVALEKIQAAVKTMEQLYVFEKNEWKRKNEPQLLTDSHVLSLLANEVNMAPDDDGARVFQNMDKAFRQRSYSDKMAGTSPPSGENFLKREDKGVLRDFQTSGGCDDRHTRVQTSGCKNVFSLSSSLKTSAASKVTQPNAITHTPFSTKTFVPKSPKLPMSLKISHPRVARNDGVDLKEVDRSLQDNENYLTIPVKSHTSGGKHPPPAEKSSVFTSSTQSQPTTPPGRVLSNAKAQEDNVQGPKRSSLVMETSPPEIPPATIYHTLPLGVTANQPQVYCFSPAITPAPTLDPFQVTQRRMLLDPTTGNYYLVDTPVQPATKRLFDPETGQYVDVPMPQPPMTPMPMSISPLALGSGAYGQTYMIYPGFMPTTSVIPARTLVQSQVAMQPEAESEQKASSQQTEGAYMEGPFYMSTGRSPQEASTAQQQGATSRQLQGFKQPVISITSQQGPRIVAPPSFDGTTMSFVVEHR